MRQIDKEMEALQSIFNASRPGLYYSEGSLIISILSNSYFLYKGNYSVDYRKLYRMESDGCNILNLLIL